MMPNIVVVGLVMVGLFFVGVGIAWVVGRWILHKWDWTVDASTKPEDEEIPATKEARELAQHTRRRAEQIRLEVYTRSRTKR